MGYNSLAIKNAGMAELADALDLGSSGLFHASSSLVTRTKTQFAGVVELADTYDSGSYAHKHAGSSPVTRTK